LTIYLINTTFNGNKNKHTTLNSGLNLWFFAGGLLAMVILEADYATSLMKTFSKQHRRDQALRRDLPNALDWNESFDILKLSINEKWTQKVSFQFSVKNKRKREHKMFPSRSFTAIHYKWEVNTKIFLSTFCNKQKQKTQNVFFHTF
jgi:hypothetical protein